MREASKDSTGVKLPHHWVAGETCLRPVRKDDRISIGDGRARVVEILRAAGIPSALRPRYPVLAGEKEVFWVPGLRLAPRVSDPPTASWAAQIVVDRKHSWEAHIFARITNPD